ncbi:uncharacterized protein [Engystomops pustulosus]|uniref:uncharacterized protein isoform X1 n=1 Tax=Engystomops pustulosus TaxID=76066 RepID=UPI003AFB1FEA
MALFNMIGSIFHASEGKTDDGSVSFTPKDSHTRRAQKGKLNKSDIGTPTNFKHVTHVGFNAVPSLDARLENDLQKLFNMAGVKEEHLQDQEVSRRIFSVLEKSGGMEAVRKQTRRMTSVERPNARSRLRSLSASNLAPSKRQSCVQPDSPHAAKMLARGSPLCYLPSLRNEPQPMEVPPRFSHIPTMRPIPPITPYDEMSQNVSPAANLSVHNHSKTGHLSAQHLSTKNSMKLPALPVLPDAKETPSETGSLPSILNHPCTNTAFNLISLPQSTSVVDNPEITHSKPAHLPSSIPCNEPLIKYGDVPSPTDIPLVAKCNSDNITPCHPKECLKPEPVFAAIPQPPPPPPLLKHCLEKPLANESKLLISQDQKTGNPTSKIQGTVASNKEPEQQANPAMFLDQIKQGVQLKSVATTSKVEITECSNLVSALMDVIKRRHKAIHSSDEDEMEDDWED